MKIHFTRKLVATVTCLFNVLLAGCGFNELGKANYPPEAQTWQKKGWSETHVRLKLADCYSQRKMQTQKVLTLEATDFIDICMLKNGFTANPYPDASRWKDPCKLEKQRALCKAYRGELIVTPDESATMPPPDLIDKPTTNTYTPPVPIAPSKNPAQVLQEQVQKDNNRQMNELLRGSDRKR